MKNEYTLDFEEFICGMTPELGDGLNEAINMVFEDRFKDFGDVNWKVFLDEMDREMKLTITFKDK